MSDQDKILQFLSVNGPVLPTKVAKLIGTEIIIASAHLSDLSAQGKVKISDLKVGGSPLYYLPGQEEQLENFAQSNMNPQDYRVMMVLKDNQILREKELDLLSKVALRNLKDFAFPLQVTYKGQAELFWKWSILADDEANHLIKESLFRAEKREQPLEQPQPEVPAPVEKPLPKAEISPEEREKKLHEIYEKTITKQEGTIKEQFHQEQQKKLEVEHKIFEKPLEKKVEHKEVKVKEVKEKVEKEKVDKTPKKKAVLSDDFLLELEEYFKSKRIVIEQKEILRKNVEISFLLKVPSVVGSLTYYCKAKNKAKCDEKDLSSAYMEAQIKKLPLLLLHTNEFTKKAQEMLDTGAFENTVVKKVE